ncbi:MAG: circularly permuted type 2 ATP-grasp protein, partial [Bryobacteraceae bacterium]
MELLPAEKMLASLDPGYPYLTVTSLLDTRLMNGSLYFVRYDADTPAGMIYGDVLADLFYDCPPVKEFRKRYELIKLANRKHLLEAILRAYRDFGGQRKPRIGILEFRQPFQATSQGEYVLLAEYLRQQGYEAEIVSPEQLEYRGGVLRRGAFEIDVIYRRVKAHEFLLRFDLSHPLVRAYREGKACVVNSFRSELAHKRALFDLLTDEKLTADFPAAERKAIRQYIPWTRLVAPRKTTYQDQIVDLLEFIRTNRDKLILKPNDDSGDEHPVLGWEVDQTTWERAIKRALRAPYVVQERVEALRVPFPVLYYGQLEMREMEVEVHPHAFLGKVQGCSCWLSAGSGFSTVEGLTPTFIIEPKA